MSTSMSQVKHYPLNLAKWCIELFDYEFVMKGFSNGSNIVIIVIVIFLCFTVQVIGHVLTAFSDRNIGMSIN